MGLFGFGKKTLKLPAFSVSAFGKLPFYKEYLVSSGSPAFSTFKDFLDEGFERLIRSGRDRPYVAPNRKFLIHMPQEQTDLVGRIWESHDGLRAFPFTLAVPLPRKVRQAEFPLFWCCLEAFWHYLDLYQQNLASQGSSTEFYNRIRGISHKLPEVAWPEWQHGLADDATQASIAFNDGSPVSLPLHEFSPERETTLIQNLAPRENPKLILWPDGFRTTPRLQAHAYLGSRGFDELHIDQFLPMLAETPREVTPPADAMPWETTDSKSWHALPTGEKAHDQARLDELQDGDEISLPPDPELERILEDPNASLARDMRKPGDLETQTIGQADCNMKPLTEPSSLQTTKTTDDHSVVLPLEDSQPPEDSD